MNAILEKKDQRAVLLIDEFQEVERVASNHGIEGAIRNLAQETSKFALIFSGSKRNLLKSMFNDRKKPLYRLYEEISLERIREEDYKRFVDKFAKEKWGKDLTEDDFKMLINCTERYPYYFNALLRSVFAQDKLPAAANIEVFWLDFAERKRNDLLSETKSLTVTHRKLLVSIAQGKNKELTSKDFLNEIKPAGSNLTSGIEIF